MTQENHVEKCFQAAFVGREYLDEEEVSQNFLHKVERDPNWKPISLNKLIPKLVDKSYRPTLEESLSFALRMTRALRYYFVGCVRWWTDKETGERVVEINETDFSSTFERLATYGSSFSSLASLWLSRRKEGLGLSPEQTEEFGGDEWDWDWEDEM